jgi:hypothetical protein
MELNKSELIEQFIAAGDLDKAERADRALPDHFNALEHAQVLTDLGLDPALLVNQLRNPQGH